MKVTKRFQINLAREGSEDSLIQNIESANQSVENAESVSESWIAGENPTAKFTYHNVDKDVVHTGLRRLSDALPYLYSTCEKLGPVRIQRHDNLEVFEPGPRFERKLDQFILRETNVRITDVSGSRRLDAIRVGERHSNSALLVILEYANQRKKVSLPESEFSKLFVTFPIAGTHFLPFNVLLDGKFTPEQERDGILMNIEDKELIVSAMSTLPSLVRHGIEAGWADAHKLADLSVPDRTFSDESTSGEAEWWERVVKDTATATAQEPLIDTNSGMLPAINGRDSNRASFLVASIDAQSSTDFEYDYIHELAHELDGLHVPFEEFSRGLGDNRSQLERSRC